jgi:PAS domain S-box-containing protein
MTAKANPKSHSRNQVLKDLELLKNISHEDFDAITELASYVCNTPISFISFIGEEEEFFISQQGIQFPKTSLSNSIGAKVLDSPRYPFVIKDLRKDEWFNLLDLKSNSQEIIFYAAIPLTLEDELSVGILGVMDYIPRVLDKGQPEALKNLGKQVVKLLELRRSEKARQLKERRYRALIEEGTDLLFMLDKDANFLEIGPTVPSKLGYQIEELKGKNVFDFIHEDDKERVKQNFERLFDSKRIEIEPFRYQNGQGDWRWLETIATNLLEDKNINGIVANSRDITEKYIALQKLAKSEARYRVFFESQTNYVIRTDLEGKYTYINKKFQEEFAWMYKNSPIGQASVCSICEHHHQRVNDIVVKCIENPEKVFKVEIDKPARDGGILTTLWDFVCLLDEAGNPSEIQCSGIDITERIRAEKELKRVNEMFELLNEASSECLYEYLPQDKLLYMGKNFERIFFHKRKPIEESLEFIHALRHPEENEKMSKIFYKTVHESKETALNIRYRLLNGKGEYRWVEDSAVILRDQNGKAIRVIGTIKDITEFHKIQLLLDVATGISKLGAWEIDVFNKSINWTSTSCEIFEVPHGFKPDFKTALTFFRQDFKKTAKDNVKKTIEEGIPFDFEAVIITANGIEKWVRVIGTPELVANKCMRVYGSFQDIHERKTAEERIKQSNERFEIITRATQDAIWDYDIASDEVFWGIGFKNLFGYDVPELKPSFQFFASLIHPQDRKKVMRKIFRIMSGKEKKNSWYGEFRLLKQDGTYAHVSDQAIFVRDSSGVVIRALGAISDISPRKEYEKSLKQLNTKLENSIQELKFSNQELEQFAYVVSHDLQEPLRMVKSFMELLEKRYSNLLDDKAKQYIHYAIDGSSRMRNIILDLLEFSRVGRHQEYKKDIHIGMIIDDVLEMYKRKISNSKAKIMIGEMPEIYSYKTPVMQIFQNLIGNSIKYSKQGIPPVIEITALSKKNFWEFSVKDNGIGIDEGDQEKIFNVFQRLHGRNEYSGTGIGLAIVKKNVESLGGKINVVSVKGEGSTFSFTIKK